MTKRDELIALADAYEAGTDAEALNAIRAALTAPGATTKSDGGGGRARDFSTVAIDENFYFTWPKDGASEVQVQDSGGTKGKSNAAPVASVDANANDDGQRVQTGNNVVTGGESATTNSSPSEPKNYFFENEEDAAEAADNGRNTGGKSYYRPSDPSSTRSEVTASLQGEDAVERVARIIDPMPFDPPKCFGFVASVINDRRERAITKARAILATGLVAGEAAIRADEREKCAAEVERANWPCVGDARRIAAAIRGRKA